MTKRRFRPFAFLVACGLLVAFALPLVALGQGDGDDDDDDDGGLERKVSVESDDEGVEIELKREEGASEDKVEVAFDFEESRFEVKHEVENGTNETEDKLEVAFERLAEYRDSNDNGRFDVGEPLVSSWSLGGDDDDDEDDDDGDRGAGRAEWRSAIVEDVDVGGQTGKLVIARAGLGEDGAFTLRMYVFGDFIDLGGASLEPTSVKVDIVIDNYPFQANDTALVLMLETEAKREIDDTDDDDRDDDEEGVTTGGAGELRLVFTWKTNATVDGHDTAVGSTLVAAKEENEDGETKQEREVALSYARGARVVHDPEFKVLGLDDEDDAASAPGPAAMLVLTVLAVAAVSARRRTG